MRTLATWLAVLAACGPAAWPRGGPPGQWTARLVPDEARPNGIVTDLVATPHALWVGTWRGLHRLDDDGPARTIGAADVAVQALLPAPGGVAVQRQYGPLTWLDDTGQALRTVALVGVPFHAAPALAALADGSVAQVVLEPRGDDQLACTIVVVDREGHEARRHDLWTWKRTMLDQYVVGTCSEVEVLAADGDLIVALPAGGPTSWLHTGPVVSGVRPVVIARLGPDGAARWRRTLAAEGAYVVQPQLALGRSTLLAVARVSGVGPNAVTVDLGPAPVSLTPDASRRGALLLVGLDPETGASPWGRLVELADGATLFLDRVRTGGGGGLALTLPVGPGGRVDGVEVAPRGVLAAALDEATGAMATGRVLRPIGCPPRPLGSLDGVAWGELDVRRVIVDGGGTVIVGGGLRGGLAVDGAEVARAPCDDSYAADRRPASSPLFAMPPPPYQPPPPPLYGFVARLRR